MWMCCWRWMRHSWPRSRRERRAAGKNHKDTKKGRGGSSGLCSTNKFEPFSFDDIQQPQGAAGGLVPAPLPEGDRFGGDIQGVGKPDAADAFSFAQSTEFSRGVIMYVHWECDSESLLRSIQMFSYPICVPSCRPLGSAGVRGKAQFHESEGLTFFAAQSAR